MSLAVDISNWGGELSPETVRAWKGDRPLLGHWPDGSEIRGEPISRVIVGVSRYTSIARQQLLAIHNESLPTEVYCYFYWGQDPGVQPAYVRSAIAGIPVQRLWLDFEDKLAPKDDPGAVRQWIRECINAGKTAGIPVGIYTGWWWWTVWPDNTTEFSDYPLWVATYDERPDLVFPTFGGWTKATMKQYTDTTEVGGYSVCRDWYEENAMPEEEMEEKLDRNILLDRWAGLIQSNDDKLIEQVYWEMQYVRRLADLPVIKT